MMILQVDREAAADIAAQIERLAIGGNDAAAIRQGIWDNEGELSLLPQAFAHHRLDASREMRERCAALIEDRNPNDCECG